MIASRMGRNVQVRTYTAPPDNGAKMTVAVFREMIINGMSVGYCMIRYWRRSIPIICWIARLMTKNSISTDSHFKTCHICVPILFILTIIIEDYPWTTISPCFMPIEVQMTGYVPGLALATLIENVFPACIL